MTNWFSGNAALALRVDGLCERLAAAWRAGERPPLEGFLVDIGRSDRAIALRELLATELECRLAHGETPTADEYRNRFPADPDVIDAAFAAIDGRAGGGRPAGATPQRGGELPTGAPAEIAERAGDQIGPYRLLEQIGEGGMGLVFVAQQVEPVQRRVALKLIKPGMDSKQVIARFEAERQALALMDHPNIAKVLDAGTTGFVVPPLGGASSPDDPQDRLKAGLQTGRPYFVMELVKGIPITDYCDRNQLTLDERLSLFVDVCHAIQHAHQKGVIHRDIKPSNVLVTSHDGKPVAKVIDFGVAKAIHGQLTDSTLYTNIAQMVGTPLYMSPEQAEMSGLDIDTRSDIYSLGVLLYELLTGSTPLQRRQFAQAAYDEVRRLIREEEPPRPSQRLSTCDTLPSIAASRKTEPLKLTRMLKGELDWVVMKALEKDRTRRYETANGLARDIQRYLVDEVVEARPASTGYRLRKIARKHKAALMTAAAIGLLLIAGIVGTTWGLVEARRQTTIARRETKEKEQARKAEAARAEGERRAKLQAEERGQEAEANLAYAKKGNELLGSVFTGLDPARIAESGRPLQDLLKENLRHAVQELDDASIGDPLTVADMQSTLGDSLVGLGEYEQAIAVLTKARDTFRATLGADHPDTLAVMNNLAWAYLHDRQIGKALPLLNETLSLMKAALGAEHPATLGAMNNLASAYRDAEDLDQALPLFEETLRLMRRTNGAEHPDTLTSMNNLADCYHAAGRLDEALPLYEESLRVLEITHGPDHPLTLMSMNNLAGGYRAAGELEKALLLDVKSFERRKATLGPDHPLTLTSMHNLAVDYVSRHEIDKAVSLFEAALTLRERRLGRQHPDTLGTIANLGVTLLKAGRLAEGLPLMEEAYEASARHASMRWIGIELLTAYGMAGKRPESARLAQELLAESRTRLSADSLELAAALAQIGLPLLQSGDAAAAEPILRECLAIREHHEPDAWTTFNAMSVLGAALLGQQKYAEAEPLLLNGYKGMMDRESTIPPEDGARIPEALDRLIDLYTKTDRPDEAEKHRAQH